MVWEVNLVQRLKRSTNHQVVDHITQTVCHFPTIVAQNLLFSLLSQYSLAVSTTQRVKVGLFLWTTAENAHDADTSARYHVESSGSPDVQGPGKEQRSQTK